MGAQIVQAVAGQVVSKALGKAMGGGNSTAKAASAETARLNAEAAAQKAEADAKRKARALQRPQTDIFNTGATQQNSGALGA